MPKSKKSKRCVTCGRNKGLHLYYKRAGNKDGHSNECKACYKLSPAYRKQQDRRYRKEFDISIDEYEEIYDEQDGRCYICRKQPRARRLAVDHDHALEAKVGSRRSVRGLLCRACNEYIGHLDDNPGKARRLVEYLERGPRWP